ESTNTRRDPCRRSDLDLEGDRVRARPVLYLEGPAALPPQSTTVHRELVDHRAGWRSPLMPQASCLRWLTSTCVMCRIAVRLRAYRTDRWASADNVRYCALVHRVLAGKLRRRVKCSAMLP